MGFWGSLLGVPPESTNNVVVSNTAELFDDDFQRKLETLAIVSRKVFAAQNRAQRRTKKRGSGVEFADHRNYAAGDDFRFVDWAVYRRFGKLLVRLFEEEEDLSIYFLVDCSKSMAFDARSKFDQARRLCAALSYVGLANLDRITIVGVGDNVEARLPPTRGRGQIFKIFRFLNNLEPTSSTNLERALSTFVAQHSRRGLAVLISDLFDPRGFERGLNMLRYNKFEPFVLHLVDENDRSVPRLGDLRLEDCETHDAREFTVTRELEVMLDKAFREHNAAIEAFCAKTQIPYFQADVRTPFDQLVLRVFREGGFLR
jgi:uncharacterized protein (DUF58 family)